MARRKRLPITKVNNEANKIKYSCIFCLARSDWNEDVMRMNKDNLVTPYSKLFKGGKRFTDFFLFNDRMINVLRERNKMLR